MVLLSLLAQGLSGGGSQGASWAAVTPRPYGACRIHVQAGSHGCWLPAEDACPSLSCSGQFGFLTTGASTGCTSVLTGQLLRRDRESEPKAESTVSLLPDLGSGTPSLLPYSVH